LREELSRVDHCCLNELEEFAAAAPSSENIAAWLYGRLQSRFADSPLRLSAVEIWESPTAGVVYTP